ncbi:hypothetical protein A9Q84_19270 [Halobacteriovorax marinus]|uniref:Extracellular solute-binding protein n=1 Tax=Halobacteriovorax marinus TaxID=97084 RepID=A0A1Y5F2F7_9BACT|nr:hypothetical protein A9Q84_19270 [Halobacteriovorax marinus]
MDKFIWSNIQESRKYVVPLLLLSVFLFSCTDKRELRLNVWKGFAPEFARVEFQKQMQEKYGIEVKVLVQNPVNEDDFYNSIIDGSADLISASHYLFHGPTYKYLQDKLLLEVDTKKLSNYKNLYPIFANFSFLKDQGKLYGVPLENSSYRLIYNSNKVERKPRSWKVLWDPKFKGKYSVSEYYFETNFYITALVSGVPMEKIFDVEHVLLNKTFLKNFDYLALNARAYWDDLERPVDIKGSHVATAFGNFVDQLKPKEDWKFSNPSEGVPGSMDFMVMNRKTLGDSKKVLLAHEWINFTISEYYQREVIMKGNGEMPVISKFKTPLSKYQKDRFMFENISYYENKRFLWPPRSREALRSMKKAWVSALSKREKKL